MVRNMGAGLTETAEPRVQRAILAIELKLHDSRLSVREIAESSRISPSYLNCLFRRSLGCGVKQYLIRSRVGAAVRMLIDSTRSVKEIAAACGFSSESHCDRCFHRVCGRNPLSFRVRQGPYPNSTSRTLSHSAIGCALNNHHVS